MDAYSNQLHFHDLFESLKTSGKRIATFDELAKSIFSGITPKSKGDAYVEPPEGVRFIRSGEITEDGGVLAESEIHISELIHSGLMRRSQLQKGDLLIAIVGATIGASGVYEYDAPANINQAIAAVRFRDTDVNVNYARWYLHSSLGQAILDYLKRPVARANINLEEIGEIPLLIPGHEQQRALVLQMEKARASRKAMLADADALLAGLDDFLLDQLGLTKPAENSLFIRKPACFAVRRSQLGERLDPKFIMFGGHNPITGTRMCSLGELIVEEPMYGLGARAVPVTSTSDPKYIRITDFDDEGIVPGNLFVTAEYYDSSRGLKPGDILFARTGATAGKTYIHTEDLGDSVFAGYCIRFRFNESLILPWYVYFYTKSSRYKTWVQSIQRPSGQPNINKEEFRSFTIPVPDMDLQKAIVNELHRRRLEARRLRDEAARVWDAAKARFEAQLLGEATG